MVSGGGAGVHERPGRRERLARLQQGLQTGQDHRPAAVELAVRARPQPVVRHREPARVLDGLDLRSEEHTSELQSRQYLVCRLLLEKKKKKKKIKRINRHQITK